MLNEFATLPNLQKIDELVNVDADKSVSCILTLQSIRQLNDMIGEQRAASLLAGLSISLIFRLQDSESVQYARAWIGRRFEEYTEHMERQSPPLGEGSIITEREMRQTEEYEWSEQVLQTLPVGYAIVARGDGWVSGQLPLVSDVDPASVSTSDSAPDYTQSRFERTAEIDNGIDASDHNNEPPD